MNHPKIIELAEACNNGACNPLALLKSLTNLMDERDDIQNPSVPIILSHIEFLLGNGYGPVAAFQETDHDWP